MGQLLFLFISEETKGQRDEPCSEFLILALCCKIGFISILYFLEKLTLKSLSLVVYLSDGFDNKTKLTFSSADNISCYVVIAMRCCEAAGVHFWRTGSRLIQVG